jgi:LPXTG-motif cell wall-anchored protein
LSITFTATGVAQGQSIQAWMFDFGDNSQVSTSSSTVNHVYTTPGIYTITVTLKGSSGQQTSVSSACTTKIDPGNVTPTPVPTPSASTQVLPATGTKSSFAILFGALLVTAGLIHIWLTQRVKLIVPPKKP